MKVRNRNANENRLSFNFVSVFLLKYHFSLNFVFSVFYTTKCVIFCPQIDQDAFGGLHRSPRPRTGLIEKNMERGKGMGRRRDVEGMERGRNGNERKEK